MLADVGHLLASSVLGLSGGDEMIVFFLTYVVLALLIVSLMGSIDAQMRKPRPKAGFQRMPS